MKMLLSQSVPHTANLRGNKVSAVNKTLKDLSSFSICEHLGRKGFTKCFTSTRLSVFGISFRAQLVCQHCVGSPFCPQRWQLQKLQKSCTSPVQLPR